MRSPPVNRMTSPFTYGQSNTHFTVAANSFGVPYRLGYSKLSNIPSCTLSGNVSVKGVVKSPGDIVMARILCRARSRASGSVMERMAPLLAAYATWVVRPSYFLYRTICAGVQGGEVRVQKTSLTTWYYNDSPRLRLKP